MNNAAEHCALLHTLCPGALEEMFQDAMGM